MEGQEQGKTKGKNRNNSEEKMGGKCLPGKFLESRKEWLTA